jgi:hypothetical protein
MSQIRSTPRDNDQSRAHCYYLLLWADNCPRGSCSPLSSCADDVFFDVVANHPTQVVGYDYDKSMTLRYYGHCQGCEWLAGRACQALPRSHPTYILSVQLEYCLIHRSWTNRTRSQQDVHHLQRKPATKRQTLRFTYSLKRGSAKAMRCRMK